MDLIIQHLRDEWTVMSGAPLALTITALVVSAILFFAFNWRYGGRIEHLEARIKLKDDQIAALHDGRPPSTPEDPGKSKIQAFLVGAVNETNRLSSRSIKTLDERAALNNEFGQFFGLLCEQAKIFYPLTNLLNSPRASPQARSITMLPLMTSTTAYYCF